MNNDMKIPFLDLVTPHRELEEELCEIFRSALTTGAFVGGPMVEGFEQEFARYCECRHSVGVGSGTEALLFALIGVGVIPGDIVVTVPNTFIATGEAISQAGAQPEFIDVDRRTYNMDPEKLREYLEVKCFVDKNSGRTVHKKTGKRVSAVVPVHLYGQMAAMDAIVDLANRYNLEVVEDACQAHGAQYFSARENAWKTAGSVGKAAAFSFYPGKNLGACGEGGAVTTNDGEIARKVRMLRDHGQAQKYYHDVEGYNGRLDAIQAGILKVKLGHLSEWNNKRRHNANQYQQLLSKFADTVQLPSEPVGSKAAYHLYVIEVADRDGLQKYLGTVNVGTGIHYPVPLHLQKAYRSLHYKQGDFPVAERAAKRIISLPMYPGLDVERQAVVAEGISEFLAGEETGHLVAAAVAR